MTTLSAGLLQTFFGGDRPDHFVARHDLAGGHEALDLLALLFTYFLLGFRSWS